MSSRPITPGGAFLGATIGSVPGLTEFVTNLVSELDADRVQTALVTTTGGTTGRLIKDKLADVISIKDFGAKGDWNGATGTDDRAALVAALSALRTAGGGVLWLPRGKYRIRGVGGTVRIPGNITIRGEGAEQSVLIWDHVGVVSRTDFIVSDVGGIANVTFQDFGVLGDWTSYFGDSIRSQMFELDVSTNFRAHRCKFSGSRYMTLIVKNTKGVTVTDCALENGYADGCRLINCEDVVVSGNRFRNLSDDSIAIHGSNTATPPRGAVVVANNVIVDSQGIACLGSRMVSITGNTITRPQNRGILVGVGGAEGATTSLAVSISNNTITDVFNGYYSFSTVNGSGKDWIVVLGTDPELDSGGDRIGYNDATAGTVVSPYPYFYDNNVVSDAAKYGAGNYGISITGNTCMRTLEATALYSDYGFGSRMNRAGYSNQAILADYIGGPQIKVTNAGRFLTISGNTLIGGDEGISLLGTNTDDWPSFDGVSILGNNISHFRDYAVHVTGGGTVICNDNVIDGDPFHTHENREPNGKWINGFTGPATPRPAAFRQDGDAVLLTQGTTLRNLFTPVAGNASNVLLADYVACCDPFAVGYHADNTGIGNMPYPSATSHFYITDGDPASATFGKIKNVCAVNAIAMPTTGTYPRGHFVTNISPVISGGKTLWGWRRVTTGNAHVSGTDWAPVYATTT